MHITINDIFLSTLRWFIGLTIGSVTGVTIGLLACTLPYIKYPINLVFHFARAVPIIGLVPLIQMAIGHGETGKIGLIAWGTTFPVWLSVESALSRKIDDLEHVLNCCNLSKREMFSVYTYPKIVGGLVLGVQVSIGIGWLCVVAAEMIGIFRQGFWNGGLGFQLFLAHDRNDWFTVFVSLAIFGILGSLTSILWGCLFHYCFKSERGFNPLLWLKHA